MAFSFFLSSFVTHLLRVLRTYSWMAPSSGLLYLVFVSPQTLVQIAYPRTRQEALYTVSSFNMTGFCCLIFCVGVVLRRFFSSSASLLNTLEIAEIIIARVVRLTSQIIVIEIKAAIAGEQDMIL